MSDLIRREDVEKAMQSICDICGEYERNCGVMCGACNLDSFISVLDDIPSAEPEKRTAKASRKPEAFFYRCECGYGLCCEKNDMNYCPMCGCRLEWE